MSRRSHDSFDYENAGRDIFDAGGDPDYLTSRDPEKRDKFMRKMGMDPKKYGSRWEPEKKDPSSDDGCYLTTACAEARGLSDDCEELTILRRYRDDYLKNRPGGAEEIRQYYAVAPQIVCRVKAQENAGEIWDRIYKEMIRPCVEQIGQGRMEEAFKLYKSYTLQLTEICKKAEE